MYQLSKMSKAIAAFGLTCVLASGSAIAATSDTSPVTNGVSQQLTGDSDIATSLNKLLPTIKYTTEGLPQSARQVNSASWSSGQDIDRTTGTKLQALLNWHHNGVGPVDGYWGKNTRKAMQAYQKANGLRTTNNLSLIHI